MGGVEGQAEVGASGHRVVAELDDRVMAIVGADSAKLVGQVPGYLSYTGVAAAAIDGVTGEVIKTRLGPAPPGVLAWIPICPARCRCMSAGRPGSGWPGH